MNQFFISCKESKIENNRSFYGCFHLGPFEPSQSITIANALRRTLLSELYGLSIVSVEIEGATHEYSNINGVKDSVLDILLNLKEIILKKTINSVGIKPQIGYLKSRGPGLVRASNLRLPPFIQCVDPDQYIATLAEDGFLNMKFIIQYGNKWGLCHGQGGQNSNIHNQNKDVTGKEDRPYGRGPSVPLYPSTSYRTVGKNKKNIYGSFNFHLKKRRLILKKLRQIGLPSLFGSEVRLSYRAASNSYINMFTHNTKFLAILSSPSAFLEAALLIKGPHFAWNWHIPPFGRGSKVPLPKVPLPKVTLPKVHLPKVPLPNGGQKVPLPKGGQKVPLPKGGYFIPAISKKIWGDQGREGEANFLETKGEQAKKIKIMLMLNNLSKKYSQKYPAINLAPARQIGPKHKSKFLTPALFFSGGYTKGISTLIRRPDNNRAGAVHSGKNINYYSGVRPERDLLNSNPLTIDAVFNPITKVNYIIEVNDFKTTQASFETSFETLELFKILNLTRPPSGGGTSNDDITLSKFMSYQTENASPTLLVDLLNNPDSYNFSTTNDTMKILNKNSNLLENILQIKREINVLKKEIPKHNIILEIWTNGSMHPRDAIYQGFKNLVKLFSQLNKINAFIINPLILNSLPMSGGADANKQIKKDFFFKKIKQNEIQTTFTGLSDLVPLNETSFFSTYMVPKIKNYYSTNSPFHGGSLAGSKATCHMGVSLPPTYPPILPKDFISPSGGGAYSVKKPSGPPYGGCFGTVSDPKGPKNKKASVQSGGVSWQYGSRDMAKPPHMGGRLFAGSKLPAYGAPRHGLFGRFLGVGMGVYGGDRVTPIPHPKPPKAMLPTIWGGTFCSGQRSLPYGGDKAPHIPPHIQSPVGHELSGPTGLSISDTIPILKNKNNKLDSQQLAVPPKDRELLVENFQGSVKQKSNKKFTPSRTAERGWGFLQNRCSLFLENPQGRAASLDLGVLNISLHSYTCLKRLKVNTINELIYFLKNNPSNLKKLSKFSLEEIERSLEKIRPYTSN